MGKFMGYLYLAKRIILIFKMIYEVSRDGETSSSCSECKKENENLGLDESS